MNLLIMRHSEAVRPGSEFSDHDRPLTARGREVTPMMAEVLLEQEMKPERILVSSARRTLETVDLLLSRLGDVEVRVVDKLYNASPMAVLEVIHLHGAGADPLLVVGHNPGLTDLANELVPGLTSNVPTAGFVAIRIDSDDWDLRTRQSADLIDYDYPKKRR